MSADRDRTYQRRHLEREVFVGADATSDWLVLPPRVTIFSLAAFPGANGDATIEVTTSPIEKVEKGEARPIAWDQGTVTADTRIAINGPVTAVRMKTNTDPGVMEVLA